MSASSPTLLYASLMHPPILHILRAAGFHSCRPSVLDTVTSIATQYLQLLARTTAKYAELHHNEVTPTITDVRLALEDCGMLIPALTGTEEAWRETLRRPLEELEPAVRAKEVRKRDEEDLAAVRSFVEWVKSDQYREIRRIAGMLVEHKPGEPDGDAVELEDYLTAIKKKHSKTGEESRYQGTVLGKLAPPHPIKIEGGPADSIAEWVRQQHERAASQFPTPAPDSIESTTITQGSYECGHTDADMDMEGMENVEPSETLEPVKSEHESPGDGRGLADTQIKEEGFDE